MLHTKHVFRLTRKPDLLSVSGNRGPVHSASWARNPGFLFVFANYLPRSVDCDLKYLLCLTPPPHIHSHHLNSSPYNLVSRLLNQPPDWSVSNNTSFFYPDAKPSSPSLQSHKIKSKHLYCHTSTYLTNISLLPINPTPLQPHLSTKYTGPSCLCTAHSSAFLPFFLFSICLTPTHPSRTTSKSLFLEAFSHTARKFVALSQHFAPSLPHYNYPLTFQSLPLLRGQSGSHLHL